MRVRCIRTCTVGVAYFEAQHVYEWPEGMPLPHHFETVPGSEPVAESDRSVVPDAKPPEPPKAPGDARPEYTGPLTMHEAAKVQGAEMPLAEADHRGVV